MKKVWKVILIVLIVLVIAVGAALIWQRKNIEGVLIGLNESSEEIEKQRDENQTNLIEEIDALLQEPLRELTEEEKKQIEEGEVQLADVYAQIFEEENTRIKQAQTQAQIDNQAQTDKQTQSDAQSQADKQIQTDKQTNNNQTRTENKPTKDEIVTNYMAQLYRLQSEFTSKSEATISQGDRYYENLKKTQDKASARANTITHFTPIVRGIEAECDAKVDAIIQNLTNELNAIGENTDIVGTIRKTYENEKQLKLAYYSNKYLK